MKCQNIRVAILSFIISLLLFSVSSCTSTPTPTPTLPSPTLLPTPPPTTEPTSILIRIEMTMTSDWAVLSITSPEHILSFTVVSTSGNPTYYDATKNGIILEQPVPSAEGGHSVGVTVDYEIAAQASDMPLDFQLEKGHLNDSFVRVYYLIGEASQLIHEVEHRGVISTEAKNLIAFSINLRSIAPITTKATTPSKTKVVPPITAAPSEAASIIFYNGQVVTIDENMTQAEALAIKGDKILAVGSDAEILAYQGANTIMIDLEGQALLPGFIDGHTHVLLFARITGRTLDEGQEVALKYGVTTMSEMFADESFLAELMQAESAGHLRLRVNAFAAFNDSILDENRNPIILKQWYPENDPILDHNRRLRIPGIKVNVDGGSTPRRGCPALSDPYEPDFVATDWFQEQCGSDRGDLYWSQAELNQIVADAQAAGYRVAFHTMGDRAIETTLNAIEFALDGQPNELYRHQIQHNSLLEPDLVERYVDLDILASIRGYFNTCDQNGYITYHGEDRYEWNTNRYKLTGLGVHAYLEMDYTWDVDPGDTYWSRNPNSLIHLYGLVTRQQVNHDGTICTPESWLVPNAISVEQALRMMTNESAYAVSQEDYLGSLEPGKFADIIILSDNPLTVDPDDLKDLVVWMTMVGGKTEYCKPGYENYCP